MDQNTQANAASSQETAATAEEMDRQGYFLTQAVNQLQVLVHGIKDPAQQTMAISQSSNPSKQEHKPVNHRPATTDWARSEFSADDVEFSESQKERSLFS